MDWKSLIEKDPVKKLAELTAKPREDKRPAERRGKLLKLLDELRGVHERGEQRRGVYKRVGDYVVFSPRVGSRKTRIAGSEFALVPHERFGDFLSGFRAHVEGGGYDRDIVAAFEGPKPTAAGAAQPREEKSKRAPDPDRSASMKAAWARRKAAASGAGSTAAP